MREAISLQGEVRALAAHGKLTGAILTALPVAIAIMMFIFSPGYMQTLYNHPLGKTLIARCDCMPGAGAGGDPQACGYQDMSSATLLITFFLFTLAAVSAAGYAFVLKPSRTQGESGNASLPLTLDHPICLLRKPPQSTCSG